MMKTLFLSLRCHGPSRKRTTHHNWVIKDYLQSFVQGVGKPVPPKTVTAETITSVLRGKVEIRAEQRTVDAAGGHTAAVGGRRPAHCGQPCTSLTLPSPSNLLLTPPLDQRAREPTEAVHTRYLPRTQKTGKKGECIWYTEEMKTNT